MAVVYLDRFVCPLGQGIRKEFIYVTNVADNDIVKSSLSKIFTSGIRLVNYNGAGLGIIPSCAGFTQNGNEVVQVFDPGADLTVIYEIEAIGR